MPKKIKTYLKGAWHLVADSCLKTFEPDHWGQKKKHITKQKRRDKGTMDNSRGISVLNEMIERNNGPGGLQRRHTVPEVPITDQKEEDDDVEERPGHATRRHTTEYKHRRRRKTSHPKEDSARDSSPTPPVPPIPDRFKNRTDEHAKIDRQRALVQARMKERQEQDLVIKGMRDEMYKAWDEADRQERHQRKNRKREPGSPRDRGGSDGDRIIKDSGRHKDDRETKDRGQRAARDEGHEAARKERETENKLAAAEQERRGKSISQKDEAEKRQEREEFERQEAERKAKSLAKSPQTHQIPKSLLKPPSPATYPWQKIWDGPNNRHYYYNRLTGVSQWNDPYDIGIKIRSAGVMAGGIGTSPHKRLTAENLATVKGNFKPSTAKSDMDRGLGDSNRTYIEGMISPEELADRQRVEREEEEREKEEEAKLARRKAEKERVEREKLEKIQAEKERAERAIVEKENAARLKAGKVKAEKERLEREEIERKKAEKKRQQPVTFLNRGIGDMNRTYIEGMISPEEQARKVSEARKQQPITVLHRALGDNTRTIIEGMVSPQQKAAMEREMRRHEPVTILNRALGDMTRTYIEGMKPPDK